MRTDEIAALLRTARNRIGLSQQELARRAGVSTRLMAEVERGDRPNVSFETALRLLHEAGVSVRFASRSTPARRGRSPRHADEARAARAAQRRKDWSGTQLWLAQEGRDEPVVPHGARLAAVTRVSRQAYVVAQAVPDDDA